MIAGERSKMKKKKNQKQKQTKNQVLQGEV